jgi:PAS domain S-box-containing protein
MSWVEIVWIMMAAASSTLAVIHLFVWLKQRSRYGHLWFFALPTSAAVFSAFELAMMRAPTPAIYASTLRWAHVPLMAMVISLVGFVYFYFQAGRTWLAYATCGLRLLALGLNFLTGQNINFREVTAIDHVELWSGQISVPVGVASPWALVPQVSNLLLLAFVIDASIALWRRGGTLERRRAVLVGSSLVSGVALAAAVAALTTTGVVHAPTIVMPGIFVVVLAMGYELGWDVIAAAQLAARLRASEARFRAVFEAAPSAILLVDGQGTIKLTNAQGESVFGYAREELVGQPVEKMLPSHMRAAHEAHRCSFIEDAAPRAIGAGRELYARRKDGGEIPVEVALNPMQRVNWAINVSILGLIIGSYVANRLASYGVERVLVGLLILAMGATVLYGVPTLRRMQADFDERRPPKEEKEK